MYLQKIEKRILKKKLRDCSTRHMFGIFLLHWFWLSWIIQINLWSIVSFNLVFISMLQNKYRQYEVCLLYMWSKCVVGRDILAGYVIITSIMCCYVYITSHIVNIFNIVMELWEAEILAGCVIIASINHQLAPSPLSSLRLNSASCTSGQKAIFQTASFDKFIWELSSWPIFLQTFQKQGKMTWR